MTSRARSKLIPSLFLDPLVAEVYFFPLLTHSCPPLEHLLMGPNFSSCRCPWSFFFQSGRRLVVFLPHILDGSPYPFDPSRRCPCCPYFSLFRVLVIRSLALFPPGSSARPLGLRNCSTVSGHTRTYINTNTRRAHRFWRFSWFWMELGHAHWCWICAGCRGARVDIVSFCPFISSIYSDQ